eukprot:COSAG02_NODE_696_length_18385_cov_48.260855_14_plen_55_part_00
MGDMPDNMSNEQIADMLVDQHLGLDSEFGVSEPSVFDDIETNRSETTDGSATGA